MIEQTYGPLPPEGPIILDVALLSHLVARIEGRRRAVKTVARFLGIEEGEFPQRLTEMTNDYR